MQICKLLSALNIKERLKELKENWFPLVVVIVGTATFAVSVISATDALLRQQVIATRLEQIGVAWLLLGALWTALGAHLNKKDRDALDSMADKDTLDAKEVVRIFKAASNFSTFGACMIFLGSIVLLIKLWWF